MTSSSRALTRQNRYPISSSKGRLNPIVTFNPLSIDVPSSINSTSEWQHPIATSHSFYYFQESLVVFVLLVCHLRTVASKEFRDTSQLNSTNARGFQLFYSLKHRSL
ncbi:hypothetical protein QL285_021085 [Trifolium repens]|nr:hypothetical protein QL285_021085 [Trifolium repens]